MSLERVPADIRKQGGVARMTDPKVEYNPPTINHFMGYPPKKDQCMVVGVITPIAPR